MGAEATKTIEALIDQCNWELRNSDGVQYTDDEQLVYYNKTVRLLHDVLIDEDSTLVRTGSGSITTEDGETTYDLSENDMGDLLVPWRVWIYGDDPMDQVEEDVYWDYVDSDGNFTTGRPDKYLLNSGHNISFVPEPDGVYLVAIVYFPNYVEATTPATEYVPYKGLFNSAIIEGMKMWARNRSRQPAAVEAALLALFQDQALKLDRKRQKRTSAITVRKR